MRNPWKLWLQKITDSSSKLTNSSHRVLWSCYLRRSYRNEKITLYNTLNPSQSLPSTHLNQNIKKSPGIQSALFNWTGDIGMDNFGCQNSSTYLCYFYFLTNLQKDIMAYVCLQLNLPLHHTNQYTFSYTTPSSSKHT